jgi:hypothetical protein
MGLGEGCFTAPNTSLLLRMPEPIRSHCTLVRAAVKSLKHDFGSGSVILGRIEVGLGGQEVVFLSSKHSLAPKSSACRLYAMSPGAPDDSVGQRRVPPYSVCGVSWGCRWPKCNGGHTRLELGIGANRGAARMGRRW